MSKVGFHVSDIQVFTMYASLQAIRDAPEDVQIEHMRALAAHAILGIDPPKDVPGT